jgi:hypothetical protein
VETLCNRDAREVELGEPSDLLAPPGHMPLAEWIGRELARLADRGDHHYAHHELEELLLFEGGGFDSPGIDFATQFEKAWALAEDLRTISPFLDAPLRRRLTAEDFVESADFPERLDASSPLRLLDFPGWQFFDRYEVDTMLGAVREALEREREVLYEEEWEEFAGRWREKGYDLALFWWLI